MTSKMPEPLTRVAVAQLSKKEDNNKNGFIRSVLSTLGFLTMLFELVFWVVYIGVVGFVM